MTEAWIDLEAAVMGIHRAESAVALGDWAGGVGPGAGRAAHGQPGHPPRPRRPVDRRAPGPAEDIRLRALACVAISSLRIGGTELPAAERSARSLVKLSPLREAGYGLLMEALAAQGNTAEALQVYDALRCRLRDELGTAPSPSCRRCTGGSSARRPAPLAARAAGEQSLANGRERSSDEPPRADVS